MATEKRKLNKSQLDFLAGVIEIWYLSWKDKLIDANGNHQLMIAKQELKEKLAAYSYRITKKRETRERPPEKKAGFLRLLSTRFDKKNPVIVYKKTRLKKREENL